MSKEPDNDQFESNQPNRISRSPSKQVASDITSNVPQRKIPPEKNMQREVFQTNQQNFQLRRTRSQSTCNESDSPEGILVIPQFVRRQHSEVPNTGIVKREIQMKYQPRIQSLTGPIEEDFEGIPVTPRVFFYKGNKDHVQTEYERRTNEPQFRQIERPPRESHSDIVSNRPPNLDFQQRSECIPIKDHKREPMITRRERQNLLDRQQLSRNVNLDLSPRNYTEELPQQSKVSAETYECTKIDSQNLSDRQQPARNTNQTPLMRSYSEERSTNQTPLMRTYSEERSPNYKLQQIRDSQYLPERRQPLQNVNQDPSLRIYSEGLPPNYKFQQSSAPAEKYIEPQFVRRNSQTSLDREQPSRSVNQDSSRRSYAEGFSPNYYEYHQSSVPAENYEPIPTSRDSQYLPERRQHSRNAKHYPSPEVYTEGLPPNYEFEQSSPPAENYYEPAPIRRDSKYLLDRQQPSRNVNQDLSLRTYAEGFSPNYKLQQSCVPTENYRRIPAKRDFQNLPEKQQPSRDVYPDPSLRTYAEGLPANYKFQQSHIPSEKYDPVPTRRDSQSLPEKRQLSRNVNPGSLGSYVAERSPKHVFQHASIPTENYEIISMRTESHNLPERQPVRNVHQDSSLRTYALPANYNFQQSNAPADSYIEPVSTRTESENLSDRQQRSRNVDNQDPPPRTHAEELPPNCKFQQSNVSAENNARQIFKRRASENLPDSQQSSRNVVKPDFSSRTNVEYFPSNNDIQKLNRTIRDKEEINKDLKPKREPQYLPVRQQFSKIVEGYPEVFNQERIEDPSIIILKEKSYTEPSHGQSASSYRDVKTETEQLKKREKVMINISCSQHPPRFLPGIDPNKPFYGAQAQQPADLHDVEVSDLATKPNTNSRLTFLDVYKKSYFTIYQHIKPAEFFIGSNMSHLSEEIWNFYENNRLSLEKFLSSIAVIEELLYFTLCKSRDSFEGCRFLLIGSILSGLATEDSDLDINAASISIQEYGPEVNGQTSFIVFKNILVSNPKVVSLKVEYGPNTKIRFIWLGESCAGVDVTVNDSLGLSNTQSMYLYVQCDWRFQPLFCAIKKWAKAEDLIGSEHHMLSSYPLSLLVIFFLQQGVTPAVLPILQEHIPAYMMDFQTPFMRAIDIKRNWHLKWTSSNTMTLGELLKQFFHFYSNFDFSGQMICVRKSKPTSREKVDQDTYMFIEEPFALCNVLKSPNAKADFNLLHEALNKANDAVQNNASLKVILNIK